MTLGESTTSLDTCRRSRFLVHVISPVATESFHCCWKIDVPNAMTISWACACALDPASMVLSWRATTMESFIAWREQDLTDSDPARSSNNQDGLSRWCTIDDFLVITCFSSSSSLSIATEINRHVLRRKLYLFPFCFCLAIRTIKRRSRAGRFFISRKS